jgi:hypothetical protein
VTLLGLCGYAGSGKDTLAAEIIKHHPEFRRVAFADKVRELAYELNPILPTGQLRYPVDLVGWDKAKTVDDYVRQYLQRLGVACRDVLGEDVWVNAALPEHYTPSDPFDSNPDVVVTDVRFPNEAVAIKDRGGYIIRIERPGTCPVNGHMSETALDLWEPDLHIQNWSTPEHMLAVLHDSGLVEPE